jgi:hypothetical protein
MWRKKGLIILQEFCLLRGRETDREMNRYDFLSEGKYPWVCLKLHGVGRSS